jgi:hypothetical protein
MGARLKRGHENYYVNLKRELGESLTNRASDGLTFYII